MKVLLVTESRGWSGGAAQTLHLAKGLRQRGHSVRIACQPASDIGQRARENDIPIAAMRIRGDMDLLAATQLYWAIRTYDIDILHAQHPKAHSVGLWAATFSGPQLPFLVTRRVSFPVSVGYFSRQKYTHPRINRYIAVSNGIRDVLIEGGVRADRIEVVYSGVDPDSFKKLSSQEGEALKRQLKFTPGVPVVIKVANYADWKGQPIFLKAAAQFLHGGGKAQFVLAGRGTDGPEALQLIQDLGLTPNVHTLGFRRDVADLLSISDLSVNSAVAGEGLSGALRESLLLGVPVIASDVSGNRELVVENETGRLVPPNNPDALAQSLKWALDHKPEAAHLTEQGKQRVLREFTVDGMVERTEAIYKTLLAAVPRPHA